LEVLLTAGSYYTVFLLTYLIVSADISSNKVALKKYKQLCGETGIFLL
jgi:hypothetical protein